MKSFVLKAAYYSGLPRSAPVVSKFLNTSKTTATNRACRIPKPISPQHEIIILAAMRKFNNKTVNEEQGESVFFICRYVRIKAWIETTSPGLYFSGDDSG
jgi:hypothetical protein